MDIDKDKAKKIKRIEELGGGYNEYAKMTLDEQLEFYENVGKAHPFESFSSLETQEITNNLPNTTPFVNGIGLGGSKRKVNFELTSSKLSIADELKKCGYRTTPKKIAQLLEEFFSGCETYNGWWLHVAQVYSPRVINWNLSALIKSITSGCLTANNPAAYFTKTLKFRKEKKKLRTTIGGRKQHL